MEALINTAVAAGGGIVVQAGASAIVSLRGLTIDVPGSNASIFISGGALHIRNCTIRRGDNEISFTPTGTSELYVANSAVVSSAIGILTAPTGSGSASVTLERVRAENTPGEGIRFAGTNTTGTIVGTVRDSVSSGATTGLYVQDSGDGTTKIMVERTTLVNNGFGIQAFGTFATIWLGNSTISGNATGLSSSTGAAIVSYETNRINGNGAGETPLPPQR